jgi:D-alanyl-D-alanine carboxypeptidase
MAVTTRSANDAAVVLAETLGGSESQFASLMTQQAHQLGMSSSSFQNASGLPDEGQISSARDLAILSSALIRDFPQYYPYFSATEFHYKGRVLPNTNRILKSYPDADGLKTGFTCGSGYNLIASAKRNGHRLIGVLLGAHSSAERFEQMGNLLDLGFEKSGNPGIHISQLRDDSYSPPPFQLSSNRCAGSAMQMGADTGSAQHEAIQIKPRDKHRHIARSNGSDWSVMLGADSRKINADANLRQARIALGPLAKTGQPQIVKRKIKGSTVWRTQWTGLQQDDAKSFCKRLRLKNHECTVLPGSTLTVASSVEPRQSRRLH